MAAVSGTLDPAESGDGAPVGRDVKVIAAVGLAHFLSHFFQLALPPLFLLLREAFDVSYVQLGALLTLFYAVSGVSQAFVGIWVDRYGARPVLLGGLALLAGATLAMGLVDRFHLLYLLVPLAGLGNSVFHPADLSILSSKVSKPRLGRAYAVHQFSGTAGYAAAPVVIGGLGLWLGWREALMVAGAFGILSVAGMAALGDTLAVPGHRGRGAAAHDPEMRYTALVRSPAMLMGFAFFGLAAMAGIGVSSFSVVGLHELSDVDEATAQRTLTAYLIASACGMLVGGWIADRFQRHDLIAIVGVGVGALLFLAIGVGGFTFPVVVALMLTAGAAVGTVAPSRDLLIRRASPPGARGKVFGLVYSGLDAGSAVAPTLFGLLMDLHQPELMYATVAVLLAASIPTVLAVERSGRAER